MTPLRSQIAEAVRTRLAQFRRWKNGSALDAEIVAGGDEEVQDVDPAKLATIVRDVRDGDLDAYLALAEIMEERDPVYRSVIGTRKLAVQGLEPRMDPAGDDAESIAIAEAVERDVVRTPLFRQMLFDLMDGVAKGYAAIEIRWDTDDIPWKPGGYRYVDPRWFRWVGEDGRDYDDPPRIRTDAVNTRARERWEWIIHTPRLKSGRPYRAGIALPACYYYLLKTFDVASWMAFVEVFGYPLRVGKYPRDATKKDRRVLAQAVMQVGRDVGAVIPEDMLIEITSMPPGSNISHYKDLAEWSDRQMEILVLGQSATTEGTQGKLGNEEAQDRVRRDITAADAQHVEVTVDRDLIHSYVDINHGEPKAGYPRFRLPVPDPEDLNLLVDSVVKLVPQGFRVGTADLYSRLRLTNPKDDDEILSAPLPTPASDRELNAARRRVPSLHAARRSEIEDDLQELLRDEDWEPLVRPVHDAVERLAAECRSYEELERRLPELLARLDGDALVRRLAIATMKARGLGDLGFRSKE